MPTDYAAIAAAWDVGQRRYTPCTTCHWRSVVPLQADLVDDATPAAPIVACGSPDVGSRRTVTPVDRALSNAGACGPEALFWLHPSDAHDRKPAARATTRERIAAMSAQLAAQRKECA